MSKQYIIVMLEFAHGNSSVGTEWIESTVFSSDTTLKQVLEWKENVVSLKKYSSLGRLMISKSYIEIGEE